jgi:HEAT repeat protein
MNLHDLESTPSWEWPDNARSLLLATLRDERAAAIDRQLAAELAGDLMVMNDELAAALIAVLENGGQPGEIRARAAISLGPVLEQVDIDRLDDSEDLPMTEATFRRIQESLRRIYVDASAPREVRRRALEGSVRAPQAWHGGAIAAAFASNDGAWKLTAVFCMRFVKGFDEQILEALTSTDPAIHYEAVVAAGNWGVEAAWPHIAGLLSSELTDKPLLLASIEAMPTIGPPPAAEILGNLLDSDDEDIIDAVQEALAIADGLSEVDASNDDDAEE